jgi:hypothetical protein
VSETGIFTRVVSALDRAGIPHMLTGSFASSFHGSPRATQDIDLVIEADVERLETFIRALPPAEYYVDRDAIEALQNESQFNVIDLETGWKVDLIIRKSRPFSVEEFGRRRQAVFEDTPLSIATVKDIVVAKLDWARMGGSHRQIEDVAAILRVRRGDLDLPYLERWIEQLGLRAEWASARTLSNR